MVNRLIKVIQCNHTMNRSKTITTQDNKHNKTNTTNRSNNTKANEHKTIQQYNTINYINIIIDKYNQHTINT